MPPLPSTLVEEGGEFWGRYPEEFRKGFSAETTVSKLHDKYLPETHFPVLGAVPKSFVAKNRRHLDMNVARFEDETSKEADRSEWGLPKPNKEAAYLSLAKYAKDVPAMSVGQVQAMNTAFQWMERHFGPYMQNSRVKTQEEVVQGLDMSTSPGFPWTRKYAKKRAMCDDWKDFSRYMEEDWERLRNPNYVAIFGNSLKEEVRPRVKIDANSIRTFTAGPIEMTIHGNRLFEDMNEKFYASHLKTASVVGFTPLKGGWNTLYRKLRKFANGFALDESQYDSSLRAFLMWGCAEFRWRMLRSEDQTPENKERLLSYYCNLVNTLIITSEGVFVRKQGGNPSGSVNTITDNTLILFVLLAYGWIMIVPEEIRSYEKFDSELSLALCGDDNTWTVSDRAVPYFNARTLIDEWGRIGITTTTDCLDPRPVEELDFLSAFTIFVDGIAVPLYNRNKLLTSLLYSRFPGDPSYTLIRACAILRVAWPDETMRCYLKELISWLVQEYGTVLQGEETWRQAMCQIPTESELRSLFLGEVSRPMVKQSAYCASGIKSCFPNMQVALPQRQRKRRVPRSQKRKAQPPPIRRGTPGYINAVRSVRRGRERGRGNRGNGRRRNGGSQMNPMTNAFPRGNLPRGRRSCVVEEDEFIAEVVGSNSSTTPTVATYPINPGQVVTFPWLAKQAAQWEKYHFEFLEFYYKPEVSGFATEGQSGKVIFSVDYDASDAPPSTKQQAEDTDPHCDAMPYQAMALALAPRQMFQLADSKYVRPGGLPGSSDIKTYDAGNLNVLTQNNGGTSAIGELHVRYRVRFEVPVLESSVNAPANNQVALFYSTAPESLTNNVAKALAMATASTNGIGAVNTAGSIVLPAGNYLLDVNTITSDSATEAFGVSTSLVINGMAANLVADGSFTLVGAGDISESLTWWFASNGTETVQVAVTAKGAAGTLASTGILRIVAI